jgi:hypothetical protein
MSQKVEEDPKWVLVQLNSFTNWVNNILKSENIKIDDLIKGFKIILKKK